MKTYTKTYDEAVKKAKQLSKIHGRYYAANSSILCPHGRSRCCIVFSKEHKLVHTIIVCNRCLAKKKGIELPRLSLI